MLFSLAILLAPVPPDRAHPAWMVGTWGWKNPGERGNDCGTDHDVTYYRNGRYEFMDESGRWRVDRNRLIETMTEPGGTGDPHLRGKPQVQRFVRIAPGRLRMMAPFPGNMIKCRGG